MGFDVRYASPLAFLERFQQLFGLDRTEENEHLCQMSMLMRAIIRFVLRDSINLVLKPSLVAAVALTLTINIGLNTEIAKGIGLGLPNDIPRQNLLRVRKGGTYLEEDVWDSGYDEINSVDWSNPIQMWTP